MPQHPTLSLSNFLNSAASSSRKRSHAEITRSESRSISPNLPSKRRRISRSMNSSLFSSSSPTPTPTPTSTSTTTVRRSERDGYDYRRPVMSSQPGRGSHGPNDLTIDLTVDSDSNSDGDSETASESASPPRSPQRANSQPQPQTTGSRSAGAPPFGTRSRQETHEVIDLSDDSDFRIEDFNEEADLVPNDESDAGSDSPDIQIVHERPAPQSNRRSQPARPPIRRPSPRRPERAPWMNFPEIIRRGTQFMFGNVQNVNDVFLDRLDGIRARDVDRRQEGVPREDDAGANFIINLDYRQPAFALGGLEIYDRSSETPQVVDEPYKGPPAPKEGFIRTFAEDDVVLCPMCGDELATGKGDTKQQVWVVKQCGHVYCGDCATNRFASKARKKDKTAPPSKATPFAECKVDGCTTKLTHKAAMFPIYL